MKASSLDQKVSEVDLALCRATLYGALALGFRQPTEETFDRLVSEEGATALAKVAAILDADSAAGLRSAALKLSADNATLSALSYAHRHLFGHTARGPAPPYETEYGAEALFQQPQELGDLAGFYLAFGLTLNPAEHERADHVSCECEFLSFLCLKKAYALEKGDLSMLEEVRKAARLFLRDHLGRFLPAFAKKLTRTAYPHPIPLPEGEGEGDSHRFYRALAELCLRFIALECARLGVSLGPQNLSLRPANDDRIPMACGSGAECAAMPGACDPEESGAV